MTFEERLLRVRQVFLDMDGTIYHGSELYPTTLPFLAFLKEHRIGYAFLSNNSSFSTEEYVRKLRRFGIEAGAENFYISTDYAIDYLHRHHPEIRRIFLLGMPSIVPAFEAAGFCMEETHPEAVIVAFDRNLCYERLCRAAYFLSRGVPGFATHPDVFCPTNQETFLPDCGAFTACLETATGKKICVLGKPDPGFLREAAARRNVPMDAVLMCGDRLATDIAVGVRAGALTCRINGPGADLTPVPEIVPSVTCTDLGELQKIWKKQFEISRKQDTL